MEREEQKLSAQLGRIHHIIMRNLESRMSPVMEHPLPPAPIRTILFIGGQPEGSIVCQRDLEEAFDLKPSSVSLLLRNMEKNGLICRKSVEGDGRLKSVHLTEYAQELSHQLRVSFDEIEGIIADGITDEERAVFITVLRKIRRNLE